MVKVNGCDESYLKGAVNKDFLLKMVKFEFSEALADGSYTLNMPLKVVVL